jgi:hypothetical protein
MSYKHHASLLRLAASFSEILELWLIMTAENDKTEDDTARSRCTHLLPKKLPYTSACQCSIAAIIHHRLGVESIFPIMPDLVSVFACHSPTTPTDSETD